MRGEGVALAFVNGGGLDEKFRNDQFVERAAEAVRHGVVNGDFAFEMFAMRNGAEVGHAAGEGGGDGEARSVGVVFHVILWRMGEKDGGRDVADGGGDLAEERDGVNDFEIVAD